MPTRFPAARYILPASMSAAVSSGESAAWSRLNSFSRNVCGPWSQKTVERTGTEVSVFPSSARITVSIVGSEVVTMS